MNYYFWWEASLIVPVNYHHVLTLLSRLNVAFCDSFYPGAVMS